MQSPVLFQSIDKGNRISSKWIAKECGKSVKHVHRDIESLQNEDGTDLDHLKDSRGYVKEYFLPLTFAVTLLGRYTGPRAVASRRLIREAVDYFINRAPEAEKRIIDLEEQLAWERRSKKQQALPVGQGPSKVLVRILVNGLLPGFEPFYVNKYVGPDEVPCGADEVAKLAHLRKTEEGVSKKRKNQEDFVLGKLD